MGPPGGLMVGILRRNSMPNIEVVQVTTRSAAFSPADAGMPVNPMIKIS